MKIIYFTHYNGMGGANRALLWMIEYLRTKYGVVPIVVMASRGAFMDECEKRGIRTILASSSYWRGTYKGFARLIKATKSTLRNITCALYLYRTLRIEGVDLIHGNSSITGIAWFLAKIMRKPLVWHIREFGDDPRDAYPMQFLYGKKISGRIFGQSDAVIAISEAIRSHYAKFIAPNEKMVTIYDGVMKPTIDTSNADITSVLGGEDWFCVCMSAGVTRGKNQIEVLRALAYLKETGRLGNIHFFILGGEKSNVGYGKELVDFASTNKIEEHVHYLGYQKDVYLYLKQMDVLICATFREGFGLCVVESMMCGVPVIGNDLGALPELIHNGQQGYIYKAGDYEELAEKILKVKNGNLGPDMGTRIRAYALENFTAERNADEVYAVYKRVLAARKNGQGAHKQV